MKHTVRITLIAEIDNDSPSTQNAQDIAFIQMSNFLNRYPNLRVSVTAAEWVSVKP